MDVNAKKMIGLGRTANRLEAPEEPRHETK
jgi:hypothetical protein